MKREKPYIATLLIVMAIFLIIFISKGIFPFGKNSLIWGDMHDQITAFYYHFYDCFKGNSSLLIDFSTSGGINFLGILAYYIISPLNFILLLFPREQIYLAVSIIVALKILLASLTCLYFIRTYFKKISCWLSIFLAIIYAFSGYSLAMYQITSWIDIMYLFPLLVIGLKKLLDLEKPIFYIVILTLSLIFNFYISTMLIIFIFLSSLIYLLVYKEKKHIKKAILSLGISTVLCLLLSSFIVIPSYLQISVSSRMVFDLGTLLNSKTGPITDKLSMYMFGGIMQVGLFLLLYNRKKHKKFLSFYIPTLLILLIPLFVEPINKIFHFGSYAFFPYRYGLITAFLLVLGAAYSFDNYNLNKPKKKIKISDKVMICCTTLVAIAGIIYLTSIYYSDFQIALETLTLSINHNLLWMLLATTLLSFLACFIIILIYKKLDYFSIVLIGIITLTHIVCNSFLYLGIDFEQERLTSQYVDLQKIEETYADGNYYRVKNITSSYIMNSGMVMRYHNLDHFTSLTDRANLRSLKKLGYSSMWVKTFSKGGTLFTDNLLANRYIMSRNKLDDEYYKYLDKLGNIYFYETKTVPSYGYFIDDNFEIMEMENSFEIQNKIYNSITGNTDKLFDIMDEYILHNIEMTNSKERIKYKIIDKDANNYLEEDIKINGRKRIYLEILKDLDNNVNATIYNKFNIYVNDKLYSNNAVSEYSNGIIDLGTYENESVNIKIQLNGDVELLDLTLGILDLNKYDKFIQNNINTEISYNKNRINIEVDSNKKQLLFLPISYNDGYSAKLNGEKVEIVRVFDNYIGIMVDEGQNEIEISFMPKGFIQMLLISLITLIIVIIILKTNIYNNLLNINWLQNIAYYIYLGLYLLAIFFIYIILTIIFIISYFVYF